jgi:flagellar biosynthesis GTPase FlhF
MLSFVESFSSFGGQGGTGIANVITEGLLSFAEFLAAVFDSFLSEFGSVAANLETVAEVFCVTGNFLYGAFEYFRGIVNGFQVINSKTFEVIGTIVEALGRLTFNKTVQRAGQLGREESAAAVAKNLSEMADAFGNVFKAAQAAGGGGTAFTDRELGVFGEAVAKARERFENRNGTASAGTGGVASQAEQARDAANSIVESIAATQKANAESWDAASKAAEKSLDEQERFLEKRTADWVRASERIAEAEAERAKRGEEIEADRLDALSRRSNQALQVGDIRSGGISEVLRIAAGREDPAIEEYRKQLTELRKIDAKINELRADRVTILGLGARAA